MATINKRRGIHFALVSKSPRLQRFLRLLRERGDAGATTMEIMIAAKVAAVSAAACELRRNGYDVTCKQEGATSDGMKVFRYTLAVGEL